MYRCITSLLAAALVAAAEAQSQVTPTFEVASVKQSVGDPGSSSSNDSPDRYAATNMPLRRLIAFAYRIHPAGARRVPDHRQDRTALARLSPRPPDADTTAEC
ncbi:MAG TPA: hypothetical protein VFD21_21965 [Vicinamibacterales bacterium]|nr:hypothetical protein [Vicinamibacterales bacterium]